MVDPVEIARGLSAPKRAALMRAEPDGSLGNHFLRWWHANSRTLKSIRKAELGTTVWSGLVLTPLGLAVRAELQKGKSDE